MGEEWKRAGEVQRKEVLGSDSMGERLLKLEVEAMWRKCNGGDKIIVKRAIFSEPYHFKYVYCFYQSLHN